MDQQYNPNDPGISLEQPQRHPIIFTGKGLEFTKLVLVNVFLGVITLGFYSPWAKVRTRKYLYGHTSLAGSNFDYVADPVKILMGRLAVGVLFILYFVGSRFSIALSIAAVGIFIIAVPWIFVRSLSFNLNNTLYRNVRFGFNRDYKGSYRAFGLGYLAAIVTLGLGIPILAYLVTKFRLKNTRFGKTYFEPSLKTTDFYVLYIRIAATYFTLLVVAIIFGMIFTKLTGVPALVAVFMVVGIYGAMLVAGCYYQCGHANLIFSNTKIGPISFEADLDYVDLLIIYLKGIALTVATLGLGAPYLWFMVIRYKVSRIQAFARPSDLALFSNAAADNAGILEDAATDLWDFDIGF